MKISKVFNELGFKEDESVGIVIGNFDGIHQGHRHLLNDFVVKCREKKITPLVISFSPHPLVYFKGDYANVLIQTISNKYKLIENLGIKHLWEIEFNSKLQNLCADNFIKNYIESIENLKLIYLGHDFALGKGKEDAHKVLDNIMKEHSVEIINSDALVINDEVCSSSKIRAFLSEGKMTMANNLLGHSYFLTGKVIRGEGLGSREIVATANLGVEKNLIIPSYGVYFTNTIIEGKTFQSITNIGRRPTVKNNGKISVETHILDFDQDIYEMEIQVDFLENLRAEQKFDSIKSLKKQVLADIKLREKYHG
jgi:riboflavin kinase/FMN adenylyltransferase